MTEQKIQKTWNMPAAAGLMITGLLVLELVAIFALFLFFQQLDSSDPFSLLLLRVILGLGVMIALAIGFFSLTVVARRQSCFSQTEHRVYGAIALAGLALVGLSLPVHLRGANPSGAVLLWLYILHFALAPGLMLLALRDDKRRDTAGLAATG